MIANNHEYRVTMEQAKELEAALSQPDLRPEDPDSRHVQLIRAGIESRLHDLRAELAEYEQRQASNRVGTRHS
jgi:hypothetical protein